MLNKWQASEKLAKAAKVAKASVKLESSETRTRPVGLSSKALPSPQSGDWLVGEGSSGSLLIFTKRSETYFQAFSRMSSGTQSLTPSTPVERP